MGDLDVNSGAVLINWHFGGLSTEDEGALTFFQGPKKTLEIIAVYQGQENGGGNRYRFLAWGGLAIDRSDQELLPIRPPNEKIQGGVMDGIPQERIWYAINLSP